MNRVYLNRLFDYYQKLLTEKEQNIFEYYYQEDLSLQEIADNLNISKSAVGKTIKIVEEKLNNYEDLLKLNEKSIKINNILKDVVSNDIIDKINSLL